MTTISPSSRSLRPFPKPAYALVLPCATILETSISFPQEIVYICQKRYRYDSTRVTHVHQRPRVGQN